MLCNFSAQSKTEQKQTGTRNLGNQTIRKGHLVIQNLGIMKGISPSDLVIMIDVY